MSVRAGLVPFRFVIGDGGRELSIMNTVFVVGTLIAKRL
jgi:hypothetical protein